jgi:glutamine amidotransferase
VSDPVIVAAGANVASVAYALERLGARAELTAEPERVARASHVILPGVGAAAEAMRQLRAANLDRLIPTLTQPVLGICLGLQLLCESSEEGDTRCLGILYGRARRLEGAPARAVPHMGWNTLTNARPHRLLVGIEDGAYAYFVHTYAVPLGPATSATCDYGGTFTAAASRGNFHGVQFHPERSAAVGARLLGNFLALGA